jgi:type IV secretory pathway VirB10-like protein
MRKTQISDWMVMSSPKAKARALRFSSIAVGVGLLLASGAVRAQDDEQDDKTFEEKIIDNVMRGIGGTNMETPTIQYRERSPLVVPPKIDLPPPANTAQVNAPNWPKDPDVQRREAAAAARRADNKDPVASSRPLTPAELKIGKTAAAKNKSNDPVQPGVTGSPMLSPSQLGFKGGLFGMFKGGDASESKQFTTEPTRETLTEPPPGYQTPSPNYAYGTGPQEPLDSKHFDIMSGKDK